MTEHRARGLTNGYLPVIAFQHLQPTEIGLVDLGGSLVPRSPLGAAWDASCRDGLLLVCLHEEPLAVIYVDRALCSLSADELAAVIWREAADAIRRHVERFQCVSPPHGPKSLLHSLGLVAGGCPGIDLLDTHVSVSVIVPTGGRPDQLERCLRSLVALEGPQLDFLVVDNQPDTEETRRAVDAITAEDSRVRYIAESRPGSSVARNRGIAETNAEFVAFTDDDVVIDLHWLDWLLSPFVEPDVTVVTGMVLPLELQSEAQKRFEQYAGFSRGITRQSYDLQVARADDRVLYPYWGGIFGAGNSMAFRRADLASAGGFDPALGAGSLALAGADIEAFSAAILRGGRLVYEPRALCWHEHRKGGDTLREQVFSYGVGFGAIMTKALTSDLRFYAAAARSVPIALGLRRRKRALASENAAGGAAAFPEELVRAQREGIVRGPLRYAESVVRAHRLGLGDVIRGG